MTKNIKEKNPFIAVVLSLAFGPFGYLYFGLNFFFAALLIAIIFTAVIYFLNLPFNNIFNYLQLAVYGYFAYTLANITKTFSKDEPSESDIIEYKSFSFALYLMIYLMITLAQVYAFVVGIYYVYLLFADKQILMGILVLVFGIALIEYFISVVFGLIAALLVKVFKIDKKYEL